MKRTFFSNFAKLLHHPKSRLLFFIFRSKEYRRICPSDEPNQPTVQVVEPIDTKRIYRPLYRHRPNGFLKVYDRTLPIPLSTPSQKWLCTGPRHGPMAVNQGPLKLANLCSPTYTRTHHPDSSFMIPSFD